MKYVYTVTQNFGELPNNKPNPGAFRQEKFDEYLKTIDETYPRIADMIRVMWGDKQLHEKLSSMIYLDTNGRNGFDQKTMAALLLIHTMHLEVFGFNPIGMIWNNSHDKW